MPDTTVLEAASLYDALGLPILLTDGNKNPGIVGERWYEFEWDNKELRRWAARHPDAQVGIKLWPLVDIEIDGPLDDDGSFMAAALAEYESLSGGIETVSWSSRRGKHFLYEATAIQQAALLAAECPATLHSAYLEFRLGAGKAAQSLIPPSTTDGVTREWINEPGETPIAELPDAIFQYVLSEAMARQRGQFRTPLEAQELRPGDVFGQKTPWREILEPHGWKHVSGEEGGVQHWTRPGKSSGISATTGFCGSELRPDCFYCFSSSPDIAPLESNHTYSKFEAYAALAFDGDFSAASGELVRQGHAPSPDGEEFVDLVEPTRQPEPAPSGLPDFVFDNPIGEYVLANDPRTEADRDAVYLQAFELFSNYVGPDIRFRMNNSVLRVNGYLLVVGDTALARKGTSYLDAAEPFSYHPDLDEYKTTRVLNGVSTGEGIVSLVADRPEGVIEGRLMLFLPEFHRALSLVKRPENTLSSILREAFDGPRISIPTKKDPLTASNAFVSMIGHITAGEFSRSASSVDFVNGLFNRVNFVLIGSTKIVINPPRTDEVVVKSLAKTLASAHEWAHNNGAGREMAWSYAAEKLWAEFYVATRKPSGDELIDSLTARAPTHVMKHAMRQAALDQTESIERKHLEIAIAIGDRCKNSAIQLMKDRNPEVEDRALLLQAVLDKGWMTRSDCYGLYRGRRPTTDIDSFIKSLIQCGELVEKQKKRDGRMVAVLTPGE